MAVNAYSAVLLAFSIIVFWCITIFYRRVAFSTADSVSTSKTFNSGGAFVSNDGTI